MVEVSFGICLEKIIIHSLFGKEFPVTDCFVAIFFRHIWVDFYIKYLLVEIFLSIFFGRLFPQFFLVGDSFENCFVEFFLQRVCGRNVSSNTFLVEVSAGIVWQRFLFREMLVEKSSSKRFWRKCVQRVFG